MDLIRDVLDNQIVDSEGRRLGKVDGIVVKLRVGEPPVLEYIETGWLTKVRRIHPRLASWLRHYVHQPYRIPWSSVRGVGVDLEVELKADETPLLRKEKELQQVLTRIPGS